MKIPFGDLSRQYEQHKEAMDAVLQGVMKKGSFILGESVRLFEEEFSSYCSCGFGIGVGSGTEALHLSLLACGVMPGDEVITVSNTAVPTISAIRSAGANPVFVDIEEDTYNMDPELIEQAITEKTKVIMPVHLYGNPCNMVKICDIAKKNGLKVIEDCAQAHGGLFNGKKTGSFGEAGCFSFYPSKNLGTFGDGGMVVTNSPEIYRSMTLLRNYGQENRYFSIIEGFNSRLDEIQAALLGYKLKFLDEWNRRRIGIANLYNKAFSNTGIICPLYKDAGALFRHVYHLYVIRVKKRQDFMDYMDSKGIKTLIHYPYPVHLQKAYEGLGFKKGSLPVTEELASEIVSLPVYPELKDSEVDYVAKTVLDFF